MKKRIAVITIILIIIGGSGLIIKSNANNDSESSTVVQSTKNEVHDENKISDNSDDVSETDNDKVYNENKHNNTKYNIKTEKKENNITTKEDNVTSQNSSVNQEELKNNFSNDKTNTDNENNEVHNIDANIKEEKHISSETTEYTDEANIEATKQETKQEASTINESSKTEITTTQEQVVEKVWHEPVYDDVWVVDEDAWTEDVYEQHSICNQCGMDITANGMRAPTHIKETDCYSYRSEMVKVNSIYHEEKGHYEKVLISEGYWE